ncbi:cytidine deaminase [Escherichia coli]|uniref:cytidine deaminase n=1 Tax=Escherichia coli TaxID=562 RepID=UPI00102D90F9|nr:cytidine deaminase [Escherichia coli]HBR0915120.1 cytidine deaminase [Klebsiella pneumoniae]EIY0233892.1 cytidine deaminase [Escherichia coli]EIZ4005035.1 cytidine deaminase [Escherichia coli]RZV84051.1 cytidine deaminase [Escherichia coli]TPV69077.1 cytidine deaminase [Escherichia coli]
MHKRFTEHFPKLSSVVADALLPIIDSDMFDGILSQSDIQMLKSKTGLNDDELALSLLPIAAAYAVVPISKFQVGAIARGISGAWYFGGNMEFFHTPLQQTIHAEQCAITHAWMSGEKGLETITVNYTPCGHCRQFMTELNSERALKISLPGRPVATLNDYLPDSFGPRDLGITKLLLDSTNNHYVDNSKDDLGSMAIKSANISHAPYTGSHSGVALRTKSGKTFCGSYAENAAYNPSIPPLQAAIIMMYIKAGEDEIVEKVVLAEKSNPLITQANATKELNSALGSDNFKVISLDIN